MSRAAALLVNVLLSCVVACGEGNTTLGGEGEVVEDVRADEDAVDVTAEDATVEDADVAQDATSTTDITSEDAMMDATEDVEPDIVEPPPSVPARYPGGRTHSPITPFVAERLQSFRDANSGRAPDVFAKVGDSITVSSAFLHCFSGSNVDFDGRTELETTRQHFLSTVNGGTTPFDRESLSAVIGKTAWWSVTGDPAPVDQELSALDPAIAVVMYGTNDIGWFSPDNARTTRWYGEHMITLVDRILQRGTLPILMSIPPYDGNAAFDLWVPTFNAVIRSIAQARQIPFIDYHALLEPISGHGLSGDGIHPNRFSGGACVFTPDALQFGYNVRNLATIQALHRVLEVTDRGMPAPDADAPVQLGAGTFSDPFVIDGPLPFAHAADTTTSTSSEIDAYTACSTANESGPEFVYTWTINSTTAFRAVAVDAAGVDIDIHLLDASASPEGCLQRDDVALSGTLQPGTYHFVLDTFVGNTSGPQPGEYFFALVSCDPSRDASCAGAL